MNTDYETWLKRLRPGSKVIIRHPWQHDRTESATVDRVSVDAGLIHIGGLSFNRKTGKTGPYEYLEQPQ